MPSGGLKSLVRVVVSLNRLQRALEPEGNLLDYGILRLCYTQRTKVHVFPQ